MKEIVLPPHLYDRIKVSAGEHGGIGRDTFFDQNAIPVCAHGHAWGTKARMLEHLRSGAILGQGIVEPELREYLQWFSNDLALEYAGVGFGQRVPFARWCQLLNVKRGEEPLRDDLLTKRLEKSVEMTQREPINA